MSVWVFKIFVQHKRKAESHLHTINLQFHSNHQLCVHTILKGKYWRKELRRRVRFRNFAILNHQHKLLKPLVCKLNFIHAYWEHCNLNVFIQIFQKTRETSSKMVHKKNIIFRSIFSCLFMCWDLLHCDSYTL